MNLRTTPLSNLLSRLRGLVNVTETGVNRRDLNCASQSEIQLELDLTSPSPSHRWVRSIRNTSNTRYL